MAFIESKNYKENLDNFIDATDSGYSFRIKDFVNNQKQKKETMGLIPIDALVETECFSEKIDAIEEEYKKRLPQGGYTRIFLENLFDEKFKTNFNILAKKKIKLQRFEKKQLLYYKRRKRNIRI